MSTRSIDDKSMRKIAFRHKCAEGLREAIEVLDVPDLPYVTSRNERWAPEGRIEVTEHWIFSENDEVLSHLVFLNGFKLCRDEREQFQQTGYVPGRVINAPSMKAWRN